MTEFIFMLTYADETVPDALAVYDRVRATQVRYVGFKDIGASPATLRRLTDRIHEDGRSVVLEVVSETADDELRSIDIGLGLGVDLLMGGTHPELVLPRLPRNGVRYLPFCGATSGHPTVLSGTPDQIGEHAGNLTATRDVHGVDLLAYRHAGDVPAVIDAVVRRSHGPVVVAGSIDRDDRIATVVASGSWGFTIGSAIFDCAFVPGADHVEQVEHVLRVAAEADERVGPRTSPSW